MNKNINSGKYLNLCKTSSSEVNKNKDLLIKDLKYNKMPLLDPNKKLNEKFTFSLSQKNSFNNNYPLIPLNKIILQKRTNPFSGIEANNNNNNQNKNDSNNNSNIYTKLDISSNKQSSGYNNIIINKEINNFSKNSINIIKYLNYKNLISRNENKGSEKESYSTRGHKKINNSKDKRYDLILRQNNIKNINDYLIVNNLLHIESDTKNIIKNKSELNSIPNKIILPKVNLTYRKLIPKINKNNQKINKIVTEKNSKISTVFNQKSNNNINVPKIIFNKRKSIIKNLKKYKALKHGIKLSIEALSIPGTNLNSKKMNQDTYFIYPDIKFANNLNNDNFIQIFGIFDGHGDYGDIISKEIKEYFLEFFNKLNLNDVNNYENLCKNNYKEIFSLFSDINAKLHAKYSNNESDICNNSGTTANIIILFRNKILSINLGHSKSIIIYKDNKIIQLNQCHTPELEEEKSRIEKNGGEIKREGGADKGPKRICYKNNESKIYSGLAVSRSFGDFNSEQLGVISIPEIKEYDIEYNNIKIMVIATDGIWEFLTNEKIRDSILPYYEENNIKGGINKLISIGNKIWSVKNPNYIDDLSAIVSFFNK